MSWRRTAGAAPRRGYRYLVPAGACMAVWVYGPVLFTVVLSFLRWDLLGDERTLAGFDNYRRLADRPEFARAAIGSLSFVIGLMPFATIVPMALAVVFWKRPSGAVAWYRAVLLLPIALAPVATAISWRFVLHPLGGLANHVLGGVGLPAQNWLGSSRLAPVAIVMVTASRVVALHFLLYAAALTGVDRRLVEAARIDGASEWEITRRLLAPLLARTTALAAFLCVVLGSQWVFTNVSVLTQGGPRGATDNVLYRLYLYGFDFFDTGLASAGAVTVSVILGAVAAGFLLTSRSGRPRNA